MYQNPNNINFNNISLTVVQNPKLVDIFLMVHGCMTLIFYSTTKYWGCESSIWQKIRNAIVIILKMSIC